MSTPISTLLSKTVHAFFNNSEVVREICKIARRCIGVSGTPLTIVSTSNAGNITFTGSGVDGSPIVGNINDMRHGSIMLTGNGVTTIYNIPHSLGVNPADVIVSNKSGSNAGFNFTDRVITHNATNIVIDFVNAPANGATATFSWIVFS